MGEAESARLLLENGADPDSEGKDKFSALYWAIYYKHRAVVDLLLRSGANPGAMSVDMVEQAHDPSRTRP
jgi:ankyrin repeat protein